MNKKPFVIFLVGPTASGKTPTAIALARMINAEIISADSMQIYQGLDILSAKPSLAQRKEVSHYLVDTLDPREEFSAAAFRDQAVAIIARIVGNKKIPLVVGGTGLYIRALTQGLFEDKGKDEEFRKSLYARAEIDGPEKLHAELEKIDPRSAASIHPRNLKRIVRALEAFHVNKVPLSTLQENTNSLDQDYHLLKFGLCKSREELYADIDKRVDEMFSQGAVEEVKKLSALNLSRTASYALGLSQISSYLKNEISLDRAKEMIKQETRNFAKRQMTWFRRDKDINWVAVDADKTAKDLAREIFLQLPGSLQA